MMMHQLSRTVKYVLQSLLGPFQKKKCPYCLNNFRLFEVRSYQGKKNCPRCGSPLIPESLRVPILVLAFFSKELSDLFQQRCATSAFITAFFHKKGYILTPFSERITFFLVSKKGKKRIKPLCILRFLSLSESDFEEDFPLRKLTNGLILFGEQPKEEDVQLLPKALKIFIQYIIHPRAKRRRVKWSYPMAVVIPSLKSLSEYLPQGFSAYTENPPPEFEGDIKLFSKYIRSLLGFWYGMPLIYTLEKSSSSILYSAFNIENNIDTPVYLSYETDVLAYFMSFWGFKGKTKSFKGFSLKGKSLRIPFNLPSFEEKKKKENPFKEKKDPSLKIE